MIGSFKKYVELITYLPNCFPTQKVLFYNFSVNRPNLLCDVYQDDSAQSY